MLPSPMSTIDDIGQRESGRPEGAVAIHLEDARAAQARWQRAEIVFAVAVSVIALHAVDARSAHAASRATTPRITDALLSLALAGFAVGMFRRSGRGFRATLALLIGTWTTIAGLGITVGHVWKIGMTGSSVTGLASLASGLTLLGLGTVMILRGAGWWRRLLTVSMLVLSLPYVFAPLTIAVFMTHVPPTILGGTTPADRGFPYRDVTVTTTDGVDLSGWYIPSRNRAAVVVIHGSGSSRLNILDHVDVLATAGYGVLALDARGHGQSEGVAMDLGWLEDRDMDAGVSFLAGQPDVDPQRIGTFGISMGAIGALDAAASDPRIGAVVAEGLAVHSFDDALTLGVDGWWHLPFYWMTTTGADLLSPAQPSMGIEEAMTRLGSRPVLLISGRGRDEGILNRKFAAAGSSRTELLELPDTKHSQGIWWHTEEWSRRVVGFLDRALLGSG